MVIAMDLADTHTNYLQLSVKKIGRLIVRRPIFFVFGKFRITKRYRNPHVGGAE